MMEVVVVMVVVMMMVVVVQYEYITKKNIFRFVH